MAAVNGTRGALTRLGVLVALLGAGAAIAAFTPIGDYLGRDGVGAAIEWLRGSPSAPLLYIAIYAAATTLAIPGSILTLAGGAIFGAVGGTIYTTIGANIGANAAFGIGRFLGRDGLRRVAGNRLEALDQATLNHGFRGLLTLRLIPAVPFNALNFGSGLTSIGWSTYAAATAIGIFPGTVVYTMFADALLAGSQEASREALLRVLLYGGLLILLSFLPSIARRIRAGIPGTTTLCALVMATSPSISEGPSLSPHGVFSTVLSQVVAQPAVDDSTVVAELATLDAYIAGADRSQDEIEHSIIRPMGEPRIHFAVNCTASGCPVLWREVHEPDMVDAPLDRAVESRGSTPEHFVVEPGSFA
ncbi:MAG: VTT domain-containing protein [Longimicrobiales bacterium]